MFPIWMRQSVVFAQLPSGRLQQNVLSPVRAKDLASRLSHDRSDRYTGVLQFTYEGRSRQNQLLSGQPANAGQNPNGDGHSAQNQANGSYLLPEASCTERLSIDLYNSGFTQLALPPRRLQITLGLKF